jgi:hypothetical protein
MFSGYSSADGTLGLVSAELIRLIRDNRMTQDKRIYGAQKRLNDSQVILTGYEKKEIYPF